MIKIFSVSCNLLSNFVINSYKTIAKNSKKLLLKFTIYKEKRNSPVDVIMYQVFCILGPTLEPLYEPFPDKLHRSLLGLRKTVTINKKIKNAAQQTFLSSFYRILNRILYRVSDNYS